MGVFSALLVLLQQIMCVKGYSTPFSGGCGAAVVGSGLVVSLIVGILVDNVKMLKGKVEIVVKVRLFHSEGYVCLFSYSVLDLLHPKLINLKSHLSF